LAEEINKRVDWHKEGKELLEAGLTLRDVMENTPHQIFAMFFRPITRKFSGRIDRVEELREFNHKRAAKGLKPLVPSWFWKG